MSIDTQQHVALYSQWVRMWNGELDLSDEIIGDDFVAHLAVDDSLPSAEIRDAKTVRAWVDAMRSRHAEMTFNVKSEPTVTGSTVVAYWDATGRARTPGHASARFSKVGIDVLRVANGKFVECWTADVHAVICAI